MKSERERREGDRLNIRHTQAKGGEIRYLFLLLLLILRSVDVFSRAT